jgi:hypothetical protein
MALIKEFVTDSGVSGEYWNIKRENGSKRVVYTTFEKDGVINKAIKLPMSCWLDEAAYKSDVVSEPIIRDYRPRQLEVPDNVPITDELIYGLIQVHDVDFFGAISDEVVNYPADILAMFKDMKEATINREHDFRMRKIKSDYDVDYSKMLQEEIDAVPDKTEYNEYKARVDSETQNKDNAISQLDTQDIFSVVY